MTEHATIAPSENAGLIGRLQWHTVATSGVRPDRRRSRRLPLRESAELIGSSLDFGATTHLEATIVDVSDKGIALNLKVPVPIGRQVAIRCTSGFAMGVVRRCVQHNSGLYICGVSFERCVSSDSTSKDLVLLALSEAQPKPQ